MYAIHNVIHVDSNTSLAGVIALCAVRSLAHASCQHLIHPSSRCLTVLTTRAKVHHCVCRVLTRLLYQVGKLVVTDGSLISLIALSLMHV